MNKSKTISFLFSACLVFLFAFNTQAQTKEVSVKEKTVELKVTGLTCAGCNSNLSNVLKETTGVLENSVKFPGDIAVVKFDSDKTSSKQIIEAIKENTSYMAVIVDNKKKKKS